MDPNLVEQALYGLLLNAVEASPQGGCIRIDLQVGAQGAALTIADEGPGLAFEPRPHGMVPGPTTKRSGTGLGIPFAFKVCEAHGWTLSFERGASAAR